MMSGEEFALQIEASDESTDAYQKKFESQAAWTGNGSDVYAVNSCIETVNQINHRVF